MIYFSLVGEQPMPILLPLWQEEQCRQALLFASPSTLGVAQSLQNFIKRDPQLSHIQSSRIVQVDAYDLIKTRDTIVETLEDIGPNHEILFNLTGGTKIMSLAVMQAVRGTETSLVYLSTEEHTLTYFRADSDSTMTLPVQVKISVDQYLNAHGLETSDSQNFGFHYSDVTPAKEGDELEERVFFLAQKSGLFDDVRRNVFIRKPGGSNPVMNELDVLVTHNGSLAVCSCKSGKVDNQALYELASLSRREVAGIYCGKVLASSKKELPPGVINRAREDHIRLVCADELDAVAQALFDIIH